MKNINLEIILGLAAALALPAGPAKAGDSARPAVTAPAGPAAAAGAFSPPAVPVSPAPGAAGLEAGRQAAPDGGAGLSGPALAVDFEKRTFKLIKKPGPVLKAAVESMLSSSYASAVSSNSGGGPMEAGFTYSLEATGAVYPFSEIEVSCIMQEKYALGSGPGICGDFFRALTAKIKRALPLLRGT